MSPSPPPRRRRTARDSDEDWCEEDTYEYGDYDYEYDEEFVDEPPIPIDESSDVPQVELADDEDIQIGIDPEDLPNDETFDPYDTSPDVQDRLRQLEHMHITDLPEHSLTIAVRDRSRWSPIWAHGRIAYPIFVALRTSQDRENRVYKCRHPRCPARVAFSVRNGEIFLDPDRTNHRHSHPVAATSIRKANSLTHEQRQQIVALWELGVSVTKIRDRVHAELHSAHAIYDTIRKMQTNERANQIQKLQEAFPKWRGWECYINRDVDDTVTDVYFFHTALLSVTKVPFRETWVMDDTSSSNLLALPLVPIVGIDERNCDQLLAFGFLCDRTAESFFRFLDWIVPQLPEPAKRGDPVPRAFMVDRHKGQFAGIERACPASAILFCARHLWSNIHDTFRTKPVLKKELKKKFWKAVRGYMCLEKWQTYLNRLLLMTTLTPAQKASLQSLLEDCGRYVGECTHPISSEAVSSRGEGLFGNFKTGEEHKPGTLVQVAGSLITYGDRWCFNLASARANPSGEGPWFDDAILSKSDQMLIGPAIRQKLKEQLDYVHDPKFTPCADKKAVLSHSCCPFARQWKIPCAHMLDARQWHSPCLKLADFSARWIIPPTPVDAPVPGHLRLGIRPLSQERGAAEWSYEYGLALVEPVLSECANNPAARNIIVDVAEAWHRVDRLPDVQGGAGNGLRDRVHPRAPGAPFTHPSYHSAQCDMQVGCYIRLRRRRLPASGRRQVRCGHCGKLGHNRRTCPDLRGSEPSE
jgi:hypothetical protein